MNDGFWEYLEVLIAKNRLVCDRPKGSTHPRYSNLIYPVDYGYLEGTIASDGSGVDVWVGSMGKKVVTGVLCTVDLFKQDTELKILYDCSHDEICTIMNYINGNQMRAIYVERWNKEEYIDGLDTNQSFRSTE